MRRHFLLSPTLAMLIGVAGCWSNTTSTGTPPAPKPEAEKPTEDLLKKIVEHKWWKKPPTEEQAKKLVQTIVETNSGNIMFINDDATTVVSKFFKDKHGDMHVTKNGEIGSWPPEGINKRFALVLIDGSKRFTLEDATLDLLKELDRVEFRDGAGR